MNITERTKFGSIYLHMIQAKNENILMKSKEIHQAYYLLLQKCAQ